MFKIDLEFERMEMNVDLYEGLKSAGVDMTTVKTPIIGSGFFREIGNVRMYLDIPHNIHYEKYPQISEGDLKKIKVSLEDLGNHPDYFKENTQDSLIFYPVLKKVEELVFTGGFDFEKTLSENLSEQAYKDIYTLIKLFKKGKEEKFWKHNFDTIYDRKNELWVDLVCNSSPENLEYLEAPGNLDDYYDLLTVRCWDGLRLAIPVPIVNKWLKFDMEGCVLYNLFKAAGLMSDRNETAFI